MGTFSEKLQSAAMEEVRKVSDAPRAIVVLLLIGFGLGALAANRYYSDVMTAYEAQMKLMTMERDAALKGMALPSSPPVVHLWPGLSLRAAVLIALVIVGVVIYALRKRTVANGLKGRLSVSAAALSAKSEELEAKHGLLIAAAQHVETAHNERDKARAELKNRKYDDAIRTLKRYSSIRVNNKEPRVTIRYCSYGGDYDLAQQIQIYFTQYAQWSVDLDGSNIPPLEKADKFKVVFDLGMTSRTYEDLVLAFSDSELLGVTVGAQKYTDRDDYEHLIVLVLPSGGESSAAKGRT